MTRASAMQSFDDGGDILDESGQTIEAAPQTFPAISYPALLPAAMLAELERQGIDASVAAVRHVPHYWKLTWDELCNLPTRDPKVFSSPVCMVTNVSAFPEAEQKFKAYRGFIRAEFVMEDGECCAVTHAYCYVSTGELLPLTEWLTQRPTPFAMRFGKISTNQPKHSVIRPLPISIEIVS